MKIYVIMEGGICQGVSTDNHDLVGVEYVVIDYDTNGADKADLTEVVQTDGYISDALIGGGYVDKLGVEILEPQEV